MTEAMKKECIRAHVYGVSDSDIAERTGLPATEVAQALTDTDAIDEERQYLREQGADV